MVLRYLGVVVLVLVGVWVLANLIASPTRFFSVFFEGIGNGALYALIALGYTLVYGIIELINFAHGDLFMLGTVFSSYLVVQWFNVTEPGARSWALLALSLVAIMALCALINTLVERLAYRRLRHAPKLAPLITAVGVSFIFQWLGTVLNGSSQKQWPSAIPDGGITMGDVVLNWTTVVVVLVTAPLLFGLTMLVQRTRQGRRCAQPPRTRTPRC